MRFALLMALTVSAVGADRAADKTAVSLVVSQFNHAVSLNQGEKLLALFTPDADYAAGGAAPIPAARALGEIPAKRLPWDERTALTMKIQAVRFVGDDTALVDALQGDSSPMMGSQRKWSCLFVLQRSAGKWLIASYRELAIAGAPHPQQRSK